MQYDHFSIYGFEVEYPKDWRVKLNPKSEKKTGEVAFHSPESDGMFVFWGVLEDAKKKYASVDEHVERTIEKVEKTRGVKSMDIVERKELEINGHRAISTHLKATFIQATFLRRREVSREVWSFHLYCEQTARYFVLHGSPSSDERSMEQADVFEHMQKTFRCHY
ncbi:MAG: hypothetical protein OEX76_00775 [Candidatus Bathyarchaeota archaeon]|nr:hypothetical protein [Candidatus Bathyarchaeota archaeon]MDH5532239.1 hypothetical protein [Candidatus Bathyarchaeota archaeon]MDH5712672.1 hypothetical protein [Candidatus Bathyarchaeota archaeon]